ncbi:MAG: hypothetical protein V8R14_02020 [Clostridia bacterium]
MEINTWHGHMTVDEIKIAAQVEGVKFIISSDAHTPDRVRETSRRACRERLTQAWI